MAAPSSPGLRPADAPAGEEKARVAFQISSKVNVPVDRETPYGGPLPASSKAAAAGCADKPSGGDVTKDGVLTPVGNGMWQLPDEEVQWVLSRRREDVRHDLFGPDCVEDVKAVRDEFFEYQAWMRAEYEANGGRVLVDDKFVAEREEHQRWMDGWSERIEGLGLGDMDFSDRLSDFYEEDSEDEVEVQEIDTN